MAFRGGLIEWEKFGQALFFVYWHQHTLSREGCDNRLFVRRIVLVLSATVLVLVLVLVLEGAAMSPSIFDHERLDVYRLAIDYVAFWYPIAVSEAKIEYEYRDAEYEYEADRSG